MPAAKASATASSSAALVTPPPFALDSILNALPLPPRRERLNSLHRYLPCSETCNSAECLHKPTLVLPHDWFPPTMGALLKLHAFTRHVAPMRVRKPLPTWSGPSKSGLPRSGNLVNGSAVRRLGGAPPFIVGAAPQCACSNRPRPTPPVTSLFLAPTRKLCMSPGRCAFPSLRCCQPGYVHR